MQLQQVGHEVESLKQGRDLHFKGTQHLRYLRPEEYPAWDELVEASPQGTVLCRSWLLNALGGDVRVLGYFRGDHLIAGIPLYFEHYFGFSVCRMPKLIHTWGIVMEPLEGKRVTVASREMEILSVFAKQLSKQTIFVQSFHPTLVNWLPFMWNGFRETTYLGYAFENMDGLDLLWDQMTGNTRRAIRAAERIGLRMIPCDSDMVASTAKKSFQHQNSRLPYSPDYLRRLAAASLENGAGQSFAAVDEKGQVHATAFIIWDHKRAYYVVGGTDPALRSSGADSLLIWNLLQFTHERAAAFDFCGSVVKSIANFFRHFGGQPISYHRISKLPRIMRLIYP
jgi:hypothetical protein